MWNEQCNLKEEDFKIPCAWQMREQLQRWFGLDSSNSFGHMFHKCPSFISALEWVCVRVRQQGRKQLQLFLQMQPYPPMSTVTHSVDTVNYEPQWLRVGVLCCQTEQCVIYFFCTSTWGSILLIICLTQQESPEIPHMSLYVNMQRQLQLIVGERRLTRDEVVTNNNQY